MWQYYMFNMFLFFWYPASIVLYLQFMWGVLLHIPNNSTGLVWEPNSILLLPITTLTSQSSLQWKLVASGVLFVRIFTLGSPLSDCCCKWGLFLNSRNNVNRTWRDSIGLSYTGMSSMLQIIFVKASRSIFCKNSTQYFIQVISSLTCACRG